jgi:hypothetical protein
VTHGITSGVTRLEKESQGVQFVSFSFTMEFVDDSILEKILSYALQNNAQPFELLCCRRFRDLCYTVAPGLPFRFPSEVKIYNHRYIPGDDWKIVNPDREYFVERLLADDVDFVRYAIKRSPQFALSGLHFPIGPHKARFMLLALIELKQAEMVQLLTGSLKIEVLGDGIIFWVIVGLALYSDDNFDLYRQRGVLPPMQTSPEQRKFWQSFIRPCILHNMRHGFHVERSSCHNGSCAWYSPVHHRNRTLSAILRFDDLELFDAYLAQRVMPERSNRPQVPGPYGLTALVHLFFRYLPAKIYQAHPEMFELQQLPNRRGWLLEAGNIERGFAIGLSMRQVEVLQVAIATKRVDCVEKLLERYTYALTRQKYGHLRRQIKALGLDPELLNATVRGKVKV